MKPNSTISVSRKFTRLERTWEAGRISRGKYTMLIRVELPTIVPVAPITEAAKKFHATRPVRTKTGKFSMLGTVRIVKTIVNTTIIKSGLSSDHTKPSTDFLYRTFRSRATRFVNRSR